MAGLTGTKRTATVIATASSIVLSLQRDKFIELIKNRPNTVLKLIDDMARKIVSLNERVVELEQED